MCPRLFRVAVSYRTVSRQLTLWCVGVEQWCDSVKSHRNHEERAKRDEAREGVPLTYDEAILRGRHSPDIRAAPITAI